MAVHVHYNERVSKALIVLACVPLLAGGACEKKTTKAGDTGAIGAADRSGDGTASAGPVDKTPLPGVDLGKLDDDKQAMFYALVGSLSSPCGKAHSLRTSVTSDSSCKRAPFAVRYIVALLEDAATDKQARHEYDLKYKSTSDPVKFDTSHAPRVGTEDAPIKLVEFFDYGCPHCQMFKPIMEKVAASEQGKVVEYFMMFPLEKHPDSKSAAQGAIAASLQGKFMEMHGMLFDKSPLHDREHVFEYARALGLDMGKFERDYAAAAPQVVTDQKQGEAAGVDSTPTLFFNSRKYEGPLAQKYIELWVDEELAVNR